MAYRCTIKFSGQEFIGESEEKTIDDWQTAIDRAYATLYEHFGRHNCFDQVAQFVIENKETGEIENFRGIV